MPSSPDAAWEQPVGRSRTDRTGKPTGLAKALGLTAATAPARKHDAGSGNCPSACTRRRETSKEEGEKGTRGRTTFRGKPEVSSGLAEGCASALSGFARTALSFGSLREACSSHSESRALSQRDLASEDPRGAGPWPAYLSSRGTLEGRPSHRQSQLESCEFRRPIR